MNHKDTVRTIENGIAVPPARMPTPNKRLMLKMKIGDSFLVDSNAERKSFFQSAENCGVTIITRKENGKGIRIWRVK